MASVDDLDELIATRKLNGVNDNLYKEKTSDEMFEELGYKKFDNHPEEDYPIEPNMWTTQDERVIEYTQKGEIKGAWAREIISFYPRGKNVVCSAYIENRATIVPISMQELKAINLKCKELGWIKE